MTQERKTARDARRTQRVRARLRRTAGEGRLRLSVHRSGLHIYAQIVDDAKGHTVAACSTLDKALKTTVKTATKNGAVAVGKKLAEIALAAGVKDVYFDRGAYPFHGRVKALADAAREAGLQF